MTLSKRLPQAIKSPKNQKRASLIFERIMAVLATANYILVVFDYTYIPLRDFWLQGRVHLFSINLPILEYTFPEEPFVIQSLPVTNWYDWVKGIEPHRDTSAYLERVKDLEQTLVEYRLDSPQVETILADLREMSEDMIDTNPFQVANKTGTLEQIKNIMRDQIPEADESAKTAFNIFWTQAYLSQNNAPEQLDFFKQKVRPLMATNYFRPIGENGKPVDNFGLLDFPFAALFLLEFLARSWFISRRRKGVSWFDAMLWRWYDILLFFPVPYWLRSIRLARILPVMIRLDQAKLVDLQAIKRQASQGFVATIAEDLTEVVVVGVLNQVQSSIRQGELTNFLSEQNMNPYVDLNDTNEVAEISRLVVNLIVNQVLPASQQDIEILLQYTVTKTIDELPAYQGIRQVPGMEQFKNDMTKRTIHQLYQIVYTQIQQLIKEDPKFDELIEQLAETLTNSVRSEMQGKESLDRLEYLLIALIEEVKINYVQRLSQEDMEELMDQTRALRQKKVTQVVDD
ncbi:hypothetical protein PN462_08610 [Spirulina sp. CS-785/01]|uniref:hypothetical protein n=1 Tax=Spirulina sp. CS-785/01 TaxID=3021716 RepID=UPI0023302D32|nr:hypothetical protein [Spirulina sp. CS-785/01]MDB9313160.1 hypothetical protein [Spirulina sp. CS-785/01]